MDLRGLGLAGASSTFAALVIEAFDGVLAGVLEAVRVAVLAGVGAACVHGGTKSTPC